jgi:hypothetical protein
VSPHDRSRTRQTLRSYQDATSPPPEGTAADATATHINIFDLIVRLIEKHVAVSDDERIAIELWVLHT